ncbi:MAG: phosphodiester glycosidase family protein [Chitinophagales bacterium]
MNRKLSLAIFGSIFPFIFSVAQLHWHRVDSLFGKLPASLQVYMVNDSLEGRPIIAYFASVRLRDKSLLFSVQTGEGSRFTPSQYFLQQPKPPILVVNGPFFSYQNGQNLSLVIRNGKIISIPVSKLKGTGEDSGIYYYPTRSAIGITRNRKADIAWIFADPQHARPYAFENGPVIAKGKDDMPTIFDLGDINWVWWEMRTAIGGGPMLVQNGKIRITSREEQVYFESENERGPRTAMGYTADNRLIILVIQGRSLGKSEGATLLQTATILKNLGCLKALNLDGGGSSCMLINGKETIQPSDRGGQRPMPAVFMIQEAEKY